MLIYLATKHFSSPNYEKTALLAGATGLIGSALLPLLLASDRYAKVIVVGRRPVSTQHPKLTQVVTDFDQLEAESLRLAADDVYCCLGTTIRQAGLRAAFYRVDFLYVAQLATLTAASFAAQFLVVSALGADVNSRFYYNRVKGETEEAVRQTALSGHPYLPAFAAARRAPYPPPASERLSGAVLKLAGPLLRGSLAKYRPVLATTVAQACCAPPKTMAAACASTVPKPSKSVC
ncbi:MAG: NAD-dependent epimerase/dehydratase family protein [Hymenobacter sp.]